VHKKTFVSAVKWLFCYSRFNWGQSESSDLSTVRAHSECHW